MRFFKHSSYKIEMQWSINRMNSIFSIDNWSLKSVTNADEMENILTMRRLKKKKNRGRNKKCSRKKKVSLTGRDERFFFREEAIESATPEKNRTMFHFGKCLIHGNIPCFLKGCFQMLDFFTALKEKNESFWPKNWVTGGTKIRTGIPIN